MEFPVFFPTGFTETDLTRRCFNANFLFLPLVLDDDSKIQKKFPNPNPLPYPCPPSPCLALSGVVDSPCSSPLHARPLLTVMTTVDLTVPGCRVPRQLPETRVLCSGRRRGQTRFFVVRDAKTPGPRIGGASGVIPSVLAAGQLQLAANRYELEWFPFFAYRHVLRLPCGGSTEYECGSGCE